MNFNHFSFKPCNFSDRSFYSLCSLSCVGFICDLCVDCLSGLLAFINFNLHTGCFASCTIVQFLVCDVVDQLILYLLTQNHVRSLPQFLVIHI